MRVSTVARVVRIPVFVAAVVAPMLVAACGNDPLSPTAQASRVSESVAKSGKGDTTTRAASGGSLPWYDAQTTSGGSLPWYRNQTTNTPTKTATNTAASSTSGGSLPWY